MDAGISLHFFLRDNPGRDSPMGHHFYTLCKSPKQALVSFPRIAARAFLRRLKCVKSRLVSHEHEPLLY
jgi:hypothetical protein